MKKLWILLLCVCLVGCMESRPENSSMDLKLHSRNESSHWFKPEKSPQVSRREESSEESSEASKSENVTKMTLPLWQDASIAQVAGNDTYVAYTVEYDMPQQVRYYKLMIYPGDKVQKEPLYEIFPEGNTVKEIAMSEQYMFWREETSGQWEIKAMNLNDGEIFTMLSSEDGIELAEVNPIENEEIADCIQLWI